MAFDITRVTHTALSVPDLEEGMESYSAALGFEWCRPQSAAMRIRTTDGDIVTNIRYTYSVEGPPHLELIEGEPGTVWAPGPGIHHVGVWTDSLAEDAAALAAEGLAVEVAGLARSGKSPVGFTYHRSPDGLRIELVDDAARPAFERWFAGGDLR